MTTCQPVTCKHCINWERQPDGSDGCRFGLAVLLRALVVRCARYNREPGSDDEL